MDGARVNGLQFDDKTEKSAIFPYRWREKFKIRKAAAE